MTSEADSPVEQRGFEPSVPLARIRFIFAEEKGLQADQSGQKQTAPVSPLEQEGFELPVPLARELLLLAKEKGPEVDLRVVSKGQSLLARA